MYISNIKMNYSKVDETTNKIVTHSTTGIEFSQVNITLIIIDQLEEYLEYIYKKKSINYLKTVKTVTLTYNTSLSPSFSKIGKKV